MNCNNSQQNRRKWCNLSIRILLIFLTVIGTFVFTILRTGNYSTLKALVYKTWNACEQIDFLGSDRSRYSKVTYDVMINNDPVSMEIQLIAQDISSSLEERAAQKSNEGKNVLGAYSDTYGYLFSWNNDVLEKTVVMTYHDLASPIIYSSRENRNALHNIPNKVKLTEGISIQATPGRIFDIEYPEGNQRMVFCHTDAKPLTALFDLTNQFYSDSWRILQNTQSEDHSSQLLVHQGERYYYITVSHASDHGSWVSAFQMN